MLSRQEIVSTLHLGRGNADGGTSNLDCYAFYSLMILLLLEEYVDCIKKLSTKDFCR